MGLKERPFQPRSRGPSLLLVVPQSILSVRCLVVSLQFYKSTKLGSRTIYVLFYSKRELS